MFSTLENEVVRILQANLPIPASSIVAGILDPPPTERPWVTFTAAAFEMLPLDEASPPTGVKEAVEDSFPVDHEGPLVLSYRPLEPLRAVEVENNQHTRVRLRERDEYTVNYLEGQLHLRQKPVGSVRVQYFTHRPLEVITGTCVRIDGRLEIWADDPGPLTTAAVGALTANVGAFDGLVSEAENIPDSGLPSLGARRAFFLFEGLQAVGGEQTGAQAWRIDYAARATLVLTPADEEIGIMRTIVTSCQISKDQLRDNHSPLR